MVNNFQILLIIFDSVFWYRAETLMTGAKFEWSKSAVVGFQEKDTGHMSKV